MIIGEKQYIEMDKEVIIEVEKFVQWLQYMLTELEITHQEFADGIGRSKKTVDRYLNDCETYFPKNGNVKKEIFNKSINFILEHSTHQYYYHIENRLFLRLFQNAVQILNDDRKEKITQEQIAKVINVGQKTICIYLNPNPPYDVKLSTEKQYKLLYFLITQGIEHLYQSGKLVDYRKFSNFDYMGYYDCKISERKQILKQLKTNLLCYLVFLLNDNYYMKYIFEKHMPKYIQFSSCIYHLIAKQIESSCRYAYTLPTIFDKKFEIWNQQKSEETEDYSFHYRINYFYYWMNYNTFDKIFQTLVYYLRCMVNQQDFQFSAETDRVYGEILTKHLKALSNFLCTFSQKDRRMKAKEILRAIEENEIALKYTLFKSITSITHDLTPIGKRKMFHCRKKPSLERTIEVLCSLPLETQEIILENAGAFFDFDENFEQDMTYLYLYKIGTIALLETGIWQELEKIVFNNMFFYLEGEYFKRMREFFGISPYEEICEGYKEFFEFWGNYINMCGNFQRIGDNKKEACFSEKNKSRFQQYVSETLCNHVNVLEVIRKKLKFDVFDWYLWGLLQIGIRTNPKETYATIARYVSTEDILILTNVYLYEEKTDYQ